MKTLRLAFALILTVVCGCIRLDQALTLREDGSGRLEVTYTIPEQTIEQLRAIYKLREDMDAAAERETEFTLGQQYLRLYLEPELGKLRKDLKQYERYGVTVEKLNVESRGAARHVKFKLAFTSLAEIAKTPIFKQYGFSLSKNSDNNYVMVRAPMDTSPLPETDLSNAEATRVLSPLLSGFRVTLRVTTPSAIRATNAPKRSLRTAEWTFDFSDDPYALRTLQRVTPQIVFSGTGGKLPEVTQTPPTIASAEEAEAAE